MSKLFNGVVLAIILVFSLLLAISSISAASRTNKVNGSAGVIKIGNTIFDKEAVIQDFTNIALSEHYFGQFGYQGNQHSAPKGNFAKLLEKGVNKETFPLLAKWDAPVKIGIQIPFDGMADAGTPSSPKVESIISDQVQKALPILRSNTRLEMTYVSNSNDVNNEPNIRIFYVSNTCWKPEQTINWFKIPDCRFDLHGFDVWAGIPPPLMQALFGLTDKYRKSIIPFTPLQRSQVEGFIFFDGKRINQSVCLIWMHHPEPLLRALTSECLLRSLGLTGVSSLAPRSLLGAWNAQMDQYNWHIGLDKNVLATSQKSAMQKFLDDFHANYIWDSASRPSDWNAKKEIEAQALFFSKVESLGNIPSIISDFDLFMLKTLYSPNLLSGYNNAELQSELYQFLN